MYNTSTNANTSNNDTTRYHTANRANHHHVYPP